MKKAVVIALLLTVGGIAWAQTENQIVPSDLKQQTIVTEPVTLRKGYFRTGVLVNYRVADRYFTANGSREYYINNTWGSKTSFNLMVQYGLSDRFQVDISSDYMKELQESTTTEVTPGTNTSKEVVSKRKGLGPGDSYLTIRYQLVPESRWLVSLTSTAKLTVPTGKKNPSNIISENQYDLPVGDGTYALTAGLYARSILYPYSFTAYMNFTRNFTGSKIINTTDATETRFRFGNFVETGIGTNLHLAEWIVLSNGINYHHEGQGSLNGVNSERMPASWGVFYEPSMIFQIRRFRLGESVTVPLKGKNIPADPLFVIMVQYVF
ncbi:MAG: hypothetical protein U0X39_14125 [Bacteroidales bacterium]